MTYDANGATGGDAPTAQSKVPGVALTLASDIGTIDSGSGSGTFLKKVCPNPLQEVVIS